MEETRPILKHDSIMEAFTKALSEIPPDKKGKVDFRVTQADASVTFGYRYKDIEAGGYVSRSWDGKVDGAGRVTWEF